MNVTWQIAEEFESRLKIPYFLYFLIQLLAQTYVKSTVLVKHFLSHPAPY